MSSGRVGLGITPYRMTKEKDIGANGMQMVRDQATCSTASSNTLAYCVFMTCLWKSAEARGAGKE